MPTLQPATRPWEALADDLLSGKTLSLGLWRQFLETPPARLAQHLALSLPGVVPSTVPVTRTFWLTNHCELPPRPERLAADQLWTMTRESLDRSLSGPLPQRIVIGSGVTSQLSIPGLEAPNLLRQWEKLLSYVREKAPAAQLLAASPQELELWQIVSGCSLAYGVDLLADHGVSALTGFYEWPLVTEWRQTYQPRLISVPDWMSVALAGQHRGMGLTVGWPMDERITPAVSRRHWLTLKRLVSEGACQLAHLVPWHPQATPSETAWLAHLTPWLLRMEGASQLALHQPWPELPIAELLTDLGQSRLTEQLGEQKSRVPFLSGPLPEWLIWRAVQAGLYHGLEEVWHYLLNP